MNIQALLSLSSIIVNVFMLIGIYTKIIERITKVETKLDMHLNYQDLEDKRNRCKT